MIKKLYLGAASASVLAIGLTATPANAQIHSFFFGAPTVSNTFTGPDEQEFTQTLDFSGHFSFDILGEGFLSLNLESGLDPDIPSFSGGPTAVSIVNYGTVGNSFDLFGDSIGGGSGMGIELLNFDFGTETLPLLADLSEFLAGDVVATATIGADVEAAILGDVTEGFEEGVITEVPDVEFTKKTPEPSATLAFLGLGLAGVGLKLVRKVKLG